MIFCEWSPLRSLIFANAVKLVAPRSDWQHHRHKCLNEPGRRLQAGISTWTRMNVYNFTWEPPPMPPFLWPQMLKIHPCHNFRSRRIFVFLWPIDLPPSINAKVPIAPHALIRRSFWSYRLEDSTVFIAHCSVLTLNTTPWPAVPLMKGISSSWLGWWGLKDRLPSGRFGALPIWQLADIFL